MKTFIVISAILLVILAVLIAVSIVVMHEVEKDDN